MKATDLSINTTVAAGVLFVCKESKKFLLCKRSDFVPSPQTWSIPGGKMDINETPQSAARREVFEEIGVDLKDKKLKLVYVDETHFPKFKFYTFARHVTNEFKPTLNYENVDYLWCDQDSLPDPLHWGLKQLFRHRRAMKKISKYLKYSN